MSTHANATTYANPFTTPGITVSGGGSFLSPNRIAFFYYISIAFDSSILGEVRNVRVTQAGTGGFTASGVSATGDVPMQRTNLDMYRFTSSSHISYIDFVCNGGFNGCVISDLTIDNGRSLITITDLKIIQNGITNPDPDGDGILDLRSDISANVNAQIQVTNIPSDKAYVSAKALLVIDGTTDPWNSRQIAIFPSSNGDGISNVSFTIVPPSSGTHTYGIQLSSLADFPENYSPTEASISETSQPTPTLDLRVGLPNVTQNGLPLNRDSDGVLVAAPNSSVHIEVPISGAGFRTPETRYTTVTLQAGSQAPPQTISLADIQSGKVNAVTFNVTFGPQDIGLQTITVTIAPNNPFSESNFQNNSANVQVKVVGAQLDVSLPDKPSDQKQVNGDTITVTAPPLVPGDTATRDLVINCVDPTTKQHVDKCKYRISMSVTNDGGHHEKSHTGDRPQIELDPDDALNSQQEIVETSGESITLTLPEVSGETTFTIKGTGPGGEQLPSKKVIFDVKIKNLFDLRPLGINFYNITHHQDDGFYGNYYFMIALQVLLVEYNTATKAVTGHAAQTLQSQAGSLSWGGLFDYPGLWKKPHSRHRDGSDIDFDPPVNRQEKKSLAQVVYKSKNLSFNPAESPNPPPGSKPVTHWHIWIKQ